MNLKRRKIAALSWRMVTSSSHSSLMPSPLAILQVQCSLRCSDCCLMVFGGALLTPTSNSLITIVWNLQFNFSCYPKFCIQCWPIIQGRFCSVYDTTNLDQAVILALLWSCSPSSSHRLSLSNSRAKSGIKTRYNAAEDNLGFNFFIGQL